MTVPEPSCIVTVAADDERQTNIRAALEFFIAEHGIEAFFSATTRWTHSFVIPEAAGGYCRPDGGFLPGEIAAGAVIEFRFMK